MMRYWFLSFLLFIAWPIKAEEVVLGLSQDRVAITATFDGSELLVFGAIKRETPIPEDPLNVIVAIAGPSEPVTVRRKTKRAGIWVNTDSVQIDSAPSFYAVATSAPFYESLSQIEDARHDVTISRAINSIGAATQTSDPWNFLQALIRIKTESNAYQLLESAVTVDQQTLFRTSIKLPSDLTEGVYPTRIFLTRNREVISEFETVIDVHKVGLERWLYTLSHQQPFVYGLLSLAIAVFAGWGASALFRTLQRR